MTVKLSNGEEVETKEIKAPINLKELWGEEDE